MSRFCPVCGKQNENTKFCIYCGTALEEVVIEPSTDTERITGTTIIREEKKKQSALGIVSFILSFTVVLFPVSIILSIIDLCKHNRGKKHGLAIAGLIIAAVIGTFFIIAVAGGNSGDSSSSPKSSNSVSEPTNIEEKSSKKEEAELSDEEIFCSECVALNWEDVARNPKDYEGKKGVIEGTIVQVSESLLSTTYRIATSGKYDDIWYVTYQNKEDEARFLEDDQVTIYGICDGTYTYSAVLGNKITIPALDAKYIYQGKVVDGQVVSFDAEKVKEMLTVEEYSYGNALFNYYFLSINNTSDFDIGIDVSAKFYDKDGNLIGADDSTCHCVPAGDKSLLYFTNDEAFEKVEYTMDVKESEYKSANKVIEYNVTESARKLIVELNNTGDKDIDSAEVSVLFFSGDKISGYNSVGFYDGDFDFKGNSSITKDIDCFDDFDSYQIFIETRYW